MLAVAQMQRSHIRGYAALAVRQYPFDPNDELAGEIGAAFAAGANVGAAINVASARAARSTFMTRLLLWTIVLVWTSAPRRWADACEGTCQHLPRRPVTGITVFRRIQNDSGSAARDDIWGISRILLGLGRGCAARASRSIEPAVSGKIGLTRRAERRRRRLKIGVWMRRRSVRNRWRPLTASWTASQSPRSERPGAALLPPGHPSGV
jgi:hypothetical protein